VYFIPADRKPEPDYRARLDRVMTDVQRFYRLGMQQHDYGKMTFKLDRDANGALRIYEVQGQGPMRDYRRTASDKLPQAGKRAGGLLRRPLLAGAIQHALHRRGGPRTRPRLRAAARLRTRQRPATAGPIAHGQRQSHLRPGAARRGEGDLPFPRVRLAAVGPPA